MLSYSAGKQDNHILRQSVLYQVHIFAFIKFIVPFLVKINACLAFLDAITQSKKSTPLATDSIIFDGVPTPIKISRLIYRCMRKYNIKNMIHFFVALANRQTAYRISR